MSSSAIAAARELLPAMVDSVEALVSVESPSDDLDACDAIVNEAIGIFSAWLPAPARAERYGGRSVFRWGPDCPTLLVLGHLDTVWPVGTLARIPFSVDEDRLRGPGVFDMKAGIVQAWAALALMGTDEDAGVGILLTTDEETGSLASRGLIEAAAQDARAVLVFEPSVDGDLKTARKGTSWYEVELRGRASHAGLEPERGINALSLAAGLVLDCQQWGDSSVGTTVTPTTLVGGTTANTVPASARLTVDVRAWSSGEQDRIDDLFRSWRPAVGSVTTTGGINRPALEPEMSAQLFAAAVTAGVEIGIGELAGQPVGGASDGNFTAALGVPTLDGMGAVGDGAHAEHEWVSVNAMAERAALAAELMSRVLAAR